MEQKKKIVGEKAVSLIQDGMIVGLGTGSTVFYFLEALSKRCQSGLSIQAVSTSRQTTALAEKFHIPLVDLNDISSIDITIDGADEIDPKKRMIKGRGGALLREKIVASSSKEVVIIVDDSKLVPMLGKGALPVEIVGYGAAATRKKLEESGYKGSFRYDNEGSLYITDNGNLLFDITFEQHCPFPEEEHANLKKIVGVVETGFFFHLAQKVVVGYSSSRVEILS
jgi:ribose 5-phosphate isomerase A